MFARLEKSFKESMNFLLAVSPPFMPTPTRGPKPPWRYFLVSSWLGCSGQARVVDPGDFRVTFEELRNSERVLRVPGDPQVEGLKADKEEPGIERA